MAKKKQTKPAATRPVADRPARKPKVEPVAKWIEQANVYILKHFRLILAGLFLLSLLLSTVYFFQAHKSPLSSLTKWQNSDMAFFEEWARHMQDDWWCDTMLHPYHDWHEVFAKNYLNLYPAEAAPYYQAAAQNGVVDSVAARKALINEIYKGKTYHQEPLYPYLIAITKSLFGQDQDWVHAWQFLLAAFTGVFIFLIGKRLFNPLVGLLASLFVLGNGAIMFFQMTLLRTTLTNFLTAMLLYLFLRANDELTKRNTIIFGVGSGIALLSQSYFILFLVPAWLWLFWLHRKQFKTVAVHAGIYVAALLITLSPLVIRNVKVGVPPFAMAGHGAMAYVPMNTKYTAPMESFFIHMETLVKIRHDAKGKMIPTALMCLGTFDSFGEFWKIYKSKINGLFMWYEMPNNVTYYLVKEYSPLIKALPVYYYWIAPLGIAGLIIALLRYRWKAVPLLIMVVASILPLFIAGNLARYRTPLVMMMCIAAAALLVQLVQWYQQRNWKWLSIGAGAAVIAFLYTSALVNKTLFTINVNDLDPMYKLHYADRLVALEQSGDNETFAKLTGEIMEYIPDYFFEARVTDPILASNEAEACRYVASLMQMHAETLEILGRQAEAAPFKDQMNVLRARKEAFDNRTK
jgi:4-amino-4-deoxy-L-arabinose transferase-like glycosyltransferase